MTFIKQKTVPSSYPKVPVHIYCSYFLFLPIDNTFHQYFFYLFQIMYELRPLHYVFKVNKRRESIEFLKKLGMQVLRHEEFSEGCKATCNGAFDRACVNHSIILSIKNCHSKIWNNRPCAKKMVAKCYVSYDNFVDCIIYFSTRFV